MEPMQRELYALTKLLGEWIRQGLSREEVLERLNDPAGVGADLIGRAVERRAAGAAFLGRSTGDEVLVEVEDVDLTEIFGPSRR